MSLYPQGVATGNAVIAAAKEWRDSLGSMQREEPGAITRRYVDAHYALVHAVDAHRATIATPQINGPDIDTDHPDPDRNRP